MRRGGKEVMGGFSTSERKILQRLSSPERIQDFLNKLRFNFEEYGETCMSPARVLRAGAAHCLEGAMLAACALCVHGEKPLLLDLKATSQDDDHVVALFTRRGRWGAISKTNHCVLRYREPVYASVRELALSFFHEYFLDDGRKTLRSYSTPVDLRCFYNRGWMTDEKDLWYIVKALDKASHTNILRTGQKLRRAEKIEIEAGKIVEWKSKQTI
jgi:hypothetical protein